MEGKQATEYEADKNNGMVGEQEVFVFQRDTEWPLEQMYLQHPESTSSGSQAYQNFCGRCPNTQLCVELLKPEEGIRCVNVVPGETLYIHRIVKVLRITGYLLGRPYTCYEFTRDPESKLVLDPEDLRNPASSYDVYVCTYDDLRKCANGEEDDEGVHYLV